MIIATTPMINAPVYPSNKSTCAQSWGGGEDDGYYAQIGESIRPFCSRIRLVGMYPTGNGQSEFEKKDVHSCCHRQLKIPVCEV